LAAAAAARSPASGGGEVVIACCWPASALLARPLHRNNTLPLPTTNQ